MTATHLSTHQGYHTLIQLLTDPEAEVRKAAAWTISVLASKPSAARDLCNSGCLQAIQEVDTSPEFRSVFSSNALERLLSTNLVAKLWMLGRLSEWDAVEDGFYEAGTSVHSVEFMSLEALSKMPLSDKLAVVTVNSRPEEKEVSAVEEKKEEGGGKERSKSRKGADSKSSKKSKHEKEQKEEEEVAPESFEPPFSIPTDPQLQELVHQVTEFARTSESGRETARQIAVVVAAHMGGEVEK